MSAKGQNSEIRTLKWEVRIALNNGHRQPDLSGPKSARLGSRMTQSQNVCKESYAQLGSVQRRFVFVFGISVRYTMFFEALALAIHLIKNTLAEQFSFAATLAETNPCLSSE